MSSSTADKMSDHPAEAVGTPFRFFDLPKETQLSIIKTLDPTTCQLLHVRMISKAFDDLVMTCCQDLTRGHEPHVFDTLKWGLDPRHVVKLDCLSKNSKLRQLPYKVIIDYDDTSDQPSHSSLTFDDLLTGDLITNFGRTWGALQLHLIGLRRESPGLSATGYRPNKIREARQLEVLQRRYSKFLASNKGHSMLRKLIKKFPNVDHLEVGNEGLAIAAITSTRRDVVTSTGLDYLEVEEEFPWLLDAMEAFDSFDEVIHKSYEYDCAKAIVDIVASQNIGLRELKLNELDAQAMTSRSIPAQLSQNAAASLTFLKVAVVMWNWDDLVSSAAQWNELFVTAKSLTKLHFTGSMPHQMEPQGHPTTIADKHLFLQKTFEGIHWPALEVLWIHDAPAALSIIDPLIMAHCKTLKSLYFRPIATIGDGLTAALIKWKAATNLDAAQIKVNMSDQLRMDKSQDPTTKTVVAMSKCGCTYWNFGNFLVPHDEDGIEKTHIREDVDVEGGSDSDEEMLVDEMD